MFVLLLLGIIVAYIAAVISFVGDTPFTVNSYFDAVVIVIIMSFTSLVPDLGYLSGASAIGLTVLMSAFVVIAGYGIFGAASSTADGQQQQDDLDTLVGSTVGLELWPNGLSGVSHWFGVCVFGFGVVPLTYNFQESMKEPGKMLGATAGALSAVALLYILMGAGLYALFPDLTADVLHELPDTGILPVLTRLAMAWTVLATSPLLIVPCAELLEGNSAGHIRRCIEQWFDSVSLQSLR